MNNEIRSRFYRVSIKALVLSDERDQFLIIEEPSGLWDLPGGGLEWGADPQEDLEREIKEEMGLAVREIAKHPSYFLTAQKGPDGIWFANVLYETVLESLNFTPSNECVATKFVSPEELLSLTVHPNVAAFGALFDPKRHAH